MTTGARRIVRQPAIDVLAKAMTEDQLQEAITGMCDHLRIKWHHETDSRKSKAGFPDLVLCGKRVAFWELKSQGGRVRPEQNEWLTAILRAEFGQARVVRPMGLLDGSVQEWLRALR